MDESWRRRRPVIQSNQVTDCLSPNDFRDVFGGPPRSVFLRHFSAPSTQNADSGFWIMTREGDPPYSTVYCKPEFVSTIQCGRDGFCVTKREAEMANETASYKPGLATSTCYGDNRCVMKREANLINYNETVRNLDHLSTTSPTRKREEPSPLVPDFRKWDGLSTASDNHNGFCDMEREDGSLYDTKSDSNVPTYFSDNGFHVMKSEVDDMCFGDAIVYMPISSRNPMTWSGNNAFQVLRREEGFYDDIFGQVCGDSNAGLRRLRSRSISKSESESTAVSCCEDGFLTNAGYGYESDRALASFASKLRPITIPSKRYDSSPPSTISEGDSSSALRFYTRPARPSSPITHFGGSSNSSNSNHPNTTNKSRCAASSFCCFTPPETLSLEPSFRMSFKKLPSSKDNSPPSVISFSTPCKVKEIEKKVMLEAFDRVETKEKQNFGSEVNAALDEAIAWAREKFVIRDDTIESENESFVSFKGWNATKGKDFAYSKER